jgi:cytochrome c oxidase subunit II
MFGAAYRLRSESLMTRFVRSATRPIGSRWAALLLTSFGLAGLLPGAAFAAAPGHPVSGQIGFQEPVTPLAHELEFFHNWVLLPIIAGICLLVLGLLIYVMVRFNEKANPEPAPLTHNTPLEVAWTVLPVMILIVISIPSFRLLTHQLVVPPADMTMKVTGKQWYWTYTYPADQGGGFEFDSTMIPESELKPGDIRQLSVDNEAVVPVGKVVHVQVTAADVLHSFTIPSFGIRVDAVPGRMNETWFKTEREGVYYGQCSKLCGEGHAFMPIAFRVVSEEEYAKWLEEAKKKYASANNTPAHFAANEIATQPQ